MYRRTPSRAPRRARLRSLVSLLVVAAAPFAATPAFAAWALNGNPLSLAAGYQLKPLAASDGQGGAYVVWVDQRNGNSDLYAQHVSAAGAIVSGWPLNGLALCTQAANQSDPQITSDGLGGAYVVWADQRSGVGTPDIYAIRVTAGGIASGWVLDGLAVCSATNYQETPVITRDGSGGALVAWADLRGASEDIYVQHVLAGGSVDATWTANGALMAGPPQQQAAPTIASDGAGGAIVAWEDGRNGGVFTSQKDLYAGRMTAAGAPDTAWAANGELIALVPGFDQSLPQAIADGAGGAIVAWTDARNGNLDLYAMRVQADGTLAPGWTPDGAEIVKFAGEQMLPVLVPDSAGGVIVAWQDGRDTSTFPTNTDIFALRLLANGTRAPGWPANGMDLTVDISHTRQDDPAICVDDAGGALVAWKDSRVTGEIYAQHVRADGTRAPGWPADGIVLCNALDLQIEPTLVSDGTGGAICAWQDYRNDFAAHDIYAQRFFGTGQVGPTVGVEGPGPQPGALSLTFAGGNPAHGAARFAVTLPVEGSARAAIYNPAGRRVAVLWTDEARPAGRNVLSWDGHDPGGRVAPPGMYYVEVTAGSARATLRFVYLP